MSLYEQFETDKNKVEKGVKYDFLKPNKDGTKPAFYLAQMSFTSKAYLKVLNAKTEKVKQALNLKVLPEDKADEINLEIFVEGVLKGWENIRDREGKDLVFNKQNAVKLMTDLPELYFALVQFASDMTNFKTEVKEEDSKN